jgi:hypothetical protein
VNKKIWIIICIILLLIFLILNIDFYLSKEFYPPSEINFVEDPVKYAGKEFTFVGNVYNITPSTFYMDVNQKPLKIYYQGLEKPKFGQLYVLGLTNVDGTVNALEVHHFSYNYIKYIISFFAFFLFLFIFFKDWKLKKWRFIENA